MHYISIHAPKFVVLHTMLTFCTVNGCLVFEMLIVIFQSPGICFGRIRPWLILFYSVASCRLSHNETHCWVNGAPQVNVIMQILP